MLQLLKRSRDYHLADPYSSSSSLSNAETKGRQQKYDGQPWHENTALSHLSTTRCTSDDIPDQQSTMRQYFIVPTSVPIL